MPKPSIASQLAAIQKQRDLLAKKEAALKAESHGKVLTQIVKMAKDAGLTLAQITHAYESQKNKSIPTTKTPSKKSSRAKSHTMKGVKLPVKYRNPLNPAQTWTGRGVDPAWVAKLRESGLLETSLIQVATEAVSSSASLN
jgi:DNA-binding protein H-NS